MNAKINDTSNIKTLTKQIFCMLLFFHDNHNLLIVNKIRVVLRIIILQEFDFAFHELVLSITCSL